MVWAAMGTMEMSTEIRSTDTAITKMIKQIEPDRLIPHLRPVIKLTDD
jgi:hypothetical protein